MKFATISSKSLLALKRSEIEKMAIGLYGVYILL